MNPSADGEDNDKKKEEKFEDVLGRKVKMNMDELWEPEKKLNLDFMTQKPESPTRRKSARNLTDSLGNRLKKKK